MPEPQDSETREAEFQRLSSEIALALAQSEEMRAVAMEVLLGATAASLAQALAKSIDSNLERQRTETAEAIAKILAAAAAREAAQRVQRPVVTQKPIPWRDAIIHGAASLIDLFPEEDQSLSSHLSCRLRRTQAVGT